MGGTKDDITEDLYRTVLALGNLDEARQFFRDLLTEKEISEFSRRWQAARMLDGNVPYSEIVRETGLSSTTVARISKWLNGRIGGYRLMINKFSDKHHPTLPRLRKG